MLHLLRQTISVGASLRFIDLILILLRIGDQELWSAKWSSVFNLYRKT